MHVQKQVYKCAERCGPERPSMGPLAHGLSAHTVLALTAWETTPAHGGRLQPGSEASCPRALA